MAYGKCTMCGCTDDDCRQCIESSGEPCFWVDNEHQICSRCYIEACERDLDPDQMEKVKAELEVIRSATTRSYKHTFTFELKLSTQADKQLRDFLKSLPEESKAKIKDTWQENGQDKNEKL